MSNSDIPTKLPPSRSATWHAFWKPRQPTTRPAQTTGDGQHHDAIESADELPKIDNRSPFIFISYRRQDSSAASRWLAETLGMAFGASAAFIDTDAIRIGDEWPARIDNALREASVLIAVIGPNWLHLADEDGRRRLDLPDDWVCNEIKYAIDHRLVVIPLLVSRAQLPKRSALPPQIASLSNYQAFELRDTYWDTDVNQLLSRLEQSGFHHIGPRVSYPRPHVRPEPLSSEELAEFCRNGWELVVSLIPGKEPLKRTELMRTYEFASFEAAIDFMSEASRFISSLNHHPRWENIWRNVTVWLTTWDIGHKPSRYDLELAQYLDGLFKRYPSPS